MLAVLATIASASLAPGPCEGSHPIRTTVAAIASAPEVYVGRCVTLTGFSDGRSLFANGRAMRRHLRMGDITLSGLRLADEMIGIYGLPQLPRPLSEVLWKSGLQWTVTGRVDTCSLMHRRAEREAALQPRDEDMIYLVMLTGHCHYLDGPVLRVDRATLTS